VNMWKGKDQVPTQSATASLTLVITLGETPAVVSETLYALMSATPARVPDAIHIVTHGRGRKRVDDVLAGTSGIIADIYHHFDEWMPKIETHVPKDACGRDIDDIVTAADNNAFANMLASLIELLANPGSATRIHLSLSGGRKTMGAYAALSLSLFGRAEDELSHVLVEPLSVQQGANNFYWPLQEEQALVKRDGTPVMTDQGRSIQAEDVTLNMALVPFVPLGHFMSNSPFGGKGIDFAAAIERMRASLAPPHIVINVRAHTICVNQVTINLSNMQVALYRLLAEAKLKDWRGAGPDGVGNEHNGWLTYDILLSNEHCALEAFAKYYDASFSAVPDKAAPLMQALESLKCVWGNPSATTRTRTAAKNEARRQFSPHKTKANKKIDDALAQSPPLRNNVRIASVDDGVSRFGLAEGITIEVVDGD
jgi:CRISPR-associated protein (TIGR02584 family)